MIQGGRSERIACRIVGAYIKIEGCLEEELEEELDCVLCCCLEEVARRWGLDDIARLTAGMGSRLVMPLGSH